MEKIGQIKVSAYTIPTNYPEADGTLEWNSTTMILVEISGANEKGVGYTYADLSAAYFIEGFLKKIVIGQDLHQIDFIHHAMVRAIRNNGTCGLAMMAVSAVDNALWDLKAKVLNLPLCNLLGKFKDEILVYGSGGFTTYDDHQLQDQFENWMHAGIQYMKMKVGASPEKDVERVKFARRIIGNKNGLFVDANGAYSASQSIEKAKQFEGHNVTWFEEPVSSDNLKGLSVIRNQAPAGMKIVAGEYGYNLSDFEAMLDMKAVDILQGDATRCGGISGFLKAGQLCEAHRHPFSSHCAIAMHLHPALALPSFYIAEYFHDHARIEEMLFDGIQKPVAGRMKPDLSRPGFGIDFKYADAEKYKVYQN